MKNSSIDIKGSFETLKAGDELSSAQDITVPDIPEDILFPDELNRYLRERVQQLTQQNGMLQKKILEYEECVHTSNTKILDLNKKLSEFQVTDGSSFVTATTASCSKITELSKKLREKFAEIEVLKTKYSKAEKLLIEYSEKLQKQEETVNDNNIPEKEEPQNVDKLKLLEDKLSYTSSKLFEVKNQNMQLKNDLKAANKLLRQEIGESFENLQSLMNVNTNWRGRAQMICDLQQKVSELKEKLKEKESGNNNNNKTVMNNRCKIEKRSEILINENKELKQALEDSKKKLEASKARCRVLESDCNNIRVKLSTISSQTEKDHEIITSLMGQIANLRNDHTLELKDKQKIIQQLEKSIKNLQTELHKEKCTNEKLQKELNEKEMTVENDSNCTTGNSARYQKLLSRLEAEKLRLLELYEITNNKLENERQVNLETQNLYRIERQKTAKLEAKLAKLQLECNTSRCSEYSVLANLSKQNQRSLEDQLELANENIKSLQVRLDLEKQERRADFMEFTRILKNYKYVEDDD